MATKLYVGNIPYDTTEDSLRELFGQDGRAVSDVFLVRDRETQRPRGFGFVEMGSEQDAEAAIQAIDGTEYEGRTLKVSVARERPRGDGGGGGGFRGRR